MSFKKLRMKGKERTAIEQSLKALHLFQQGMGWESVGSCVQDSVIIREVLQRHFKIKAEVISADLSAWNENMVNCLRESNRTGDDLSAVLDRIEDGDFADFSCAAPRTVRCFHEQAMGGDGFDGHALVRTNNYIIDPTAGQAARHELEIPPMMIFEREQFGELDDSKFDYVRFSLKGMPQSNKTTREAGGLPEIDRSSPNPIEDDTQSLMQAKGLALGEVAVVKCGIQSYYGLTLRPDRSISEDYPRWNHPVFRANTKRMVEVLRTMLKNGLDSKFKITKIEQE